MEMGTYSYIKVITCFRSGFSTRRLRTSPTGRFSSVDERRVWPQPVVRSEALRAERAPHIRHRHPSPRDVRRPHPTLALLHELPKVRHLLVRIRRDTQDGARIDPIDARLHHFLQLRLRALVDRAYAPATTVEGEVYHEVELRAFNADHNRDEPHEVWMGRCRAEYLQELVAVPDGGRRGPQRLRERVVVAVDE